MIFRAEEYYQAAGERMAQARVLYTAGKSYALAMYAAGLAVECLLRAFRWKIDRSFDGRHDLEDLLKASHLLAIQEEHLRQEGLPEIETQALVLLLRTAMTEVIALWHNNLRFASEARLRSYLNQMGRLRGIKGDGRKKNALDLLNAAQRILDQGVLLWTSAKK